MSCQYTATVPACVLDPDDGDGEMTVAFTFTPGQPETPPSYDCGGEPAYGPEIEIDSVEGAPVGIIDEDKIADWLAENWDGPGEPDYD